MKLPAKRLRQGTWYGAFARSADEILISDPKLEKRRGNALRSSDVTAGVMGMDAVIQVLGVSLGELFWPVNLFSDATRILIAAMQAQGVKRLISVTGFGAGDSCASINCFQILPFRFFFGRKFLRSPRSGVMGPFHGQTSPIFWCSRLKMVPMCAKRPYWCIRSDTWWVRH